MKSLYYYRDRYVRAQPTAFCPGCGGGIILQCFLRAIDDLGIDKDRILAVSGIGCSAWIPSPYFDGDTLHTTHGRAIAFATGAKAFNPDLTTVVFTGDGDGAGIGGNHLIHAARRNIDLKVFLVNNFSYAMTGAQTAPTTLHGETTVTSPYGNPESPFDITQLVKAAGATYVAKWSTYHVVELTNAMKEPLQHKGFSFIEAVVPCPTEYGRRNISGNVLRMLDDERGRSIAKSKADKLPADELAGKIVTGVLFENTRAPEFREAYAASAQAQAERVAKKAQAVAVEKPPMGQQK